MLLLNSRLGHIAVHGKSAGKQVQDNDYKINYKIL